MQTVRAHSTGSKPGSELSIHLKSSARDEGSCSTVHVTLSCPTAADYTPGGTYDAVEAYVCGQPAAGAVPARCSQHWFSQFVCYAADKQPVAIASTPAQLARILGVQQVLFRDANTGQLQQEQPGGWPAAASSAAAAAPTAAAATQPCAAEEHGASQQPPAALTYMVQAAAAAAAAAASDDADDEAAALAGLLQDDDAEQPASAVLQAEQLLEVQKPHGNWHMHACAALFVLLDVASADSYQQQQRHTVLQAVRCGNEAGNKVICGRHRKEGRIFVIAKNGDVLASCSCLAELAPLLGVRRVRVQDDLGDLQEKLQQQQLAGPEAAVARSNSASGISCSGSAAGTVSAAAHDFAGVGQKRLRLEAGPSSPGISKVAASGAGLLGSTAAAAAAGPVTLQPLPVASLTGAVLRLHLTLDQAERVRQQLLQQAQQRLPYVQAGLQGPPGQQQEGRQMAHVDAWKLSQLQQCHLDVQLSVTPGSCSQHPCLGINLRLGVSGLQELAAASGPVAVDGGRRCGNEGGLRRCCKQHRGSLILLSGQQGQQLPGAAHLDGLASMLKVSRVELLDSLSQTPLQEYAQLPPAPTWQTCADRSSLRVWLPGSISCKGCRGLDFVVALPQDTTHSIGSLLPVVTVLKCGNQAAAKLGNRFACRKHQAGLLHIVAQGAAAPFQECSNLGELAVWLGVGQVEVLCSATNQAIELYSALGDQPLQLSMPCMAGPQGQEGFAPPTLQLNLAACLQAGAPTAAAAVATGTDEEQQQHAALASSSSSGNSITQLLAGSNCLFEVSREAGSLLLKVEGKPVGACQRNACRSISLLLGLPKGACTLTPGGDYPLLAVQRCGNEAGSRTRCRTHHDAPLTLLCACAPPQPAAASAAAAAAAGVQPEGRRDQPQLTVLAKVGSNDKLAQLLGLRGDVALQDKETGEGLGDASQWSASTADGKAAKLPQVQAQEAEDAAAAAAVAAMAAAGLPRSLAAALAKSAAAHSVQLPSSSWPAGGGSLGKEQQQQQPVEQQQPAELQQQPEAQAVVAEPNAAAVSVTCSDAAAAVAAAATDGVAVGSQLDDNAATAVERLALPDTLPGSVSDAGFLLSSSAAACTAAGSTPTAVAIAEDKAAPAPVGPAAAATAALAGDTAQTVSAAELNGFVPAATASEMEVAAAGPASNGPASSAAAAAAAVAGGFTTSAPAAHLARLAAAFKPHV